METAVVTSLISGAFSLATAVLSVWLKQYLEERRRTVAVAQPQAARVEGVEVRSVPRHWNVSRPFLVLLGGFIVGVVSRTLRDVMRSGGVHYEALLSIVLLGGTCLVLALNHRKSEQGFWPYQLEVFALWAAYTSGWSLVHGHVWSDLIALTFLWWMACAFVGGLVVIVARRKGRLATVPPAKAGTKSGAA